MSKVKDCLTVAGKKYCLYSLKKAKEVGLSNIDKLPRSLKVLLENLLRHEDGNTVHWEDIEAINDWAHHQTSKHEIAFHPARVVMQDFTGVPAVVDLAAMREAIEDLGGDAKKINPLTPVDLVIDHSVQVEHFGNKEAFQKNVAIEYERNYERYKFLKWGQESFSNFRVVPPGTGIIHQVNLEYLAKVVWTKDEGENTFAYPDTSVGTDSHTTMINGLSVLGWGVGGIEAEAAMLGQPVTMLIPEVVGFKMTGKLSQGVTATDLVLFVVEKLRAHGVVGKFVEFFGAGMTNLSLADRATLANMAPEYGATCGFFPIDEKTLEYLEISGRDRANIDLVESYAKEQGLWWDEKDEDPLFTSIVHLNLEDVAPCISGPKRPQDKILLSDTTLEFNQALEKEYKIDLEKRKEHFQVVGEKYNISHGAVVIAAITSCTNTSNPDVLVAAGLLAKKALEKGLKTKPWVKTSLAPGSQVVTDYLEKSGLQTSLDELGFNLVGYGCTTCIGNSGPLPENISKTINEHNIVATSVLSGNRNFEGRINPDVKANYLASPPLVVAYALAGTMTMNIHIDPIGKDRDGNDVYLKDIWPSDSEIKEIVSGNISREMYNKRYENVFAGDKLWQEVKSSSTDKYEWDESSTYIRRPSFFDDIKEGERKDFKVNDASILALLGDSVTTDHISPAGVISSKSPAGEYLESKNVNKKDYNSYGSRRGNHEVMMRGTFANIRIRNEMLLNVEGGYTIHMPTGKQMSIYDAAMVYKSHDVPLVIIAGKEYGTGSSRDWAAKGTNLQGVKAVIAESFERIHRSNLIGMGVMPLQFQNSKGRASLMLNGSEKISLSLKGKLSAQMIVEMKVHRDNGEVQEMDLLCRIDTADELNYFKNGGILHYVLRKLNQS